MLNKDFRKLTAEKLKFPIEVIDTVLSFKEKILAEALRKYKTVEDTGLGIFSIREKQVQREINTLEKEIEGLTGRIKSGKIKEEKLYRAEDALKNYKEDIEYLKTKL